MRIPLTDLEVRSGTSRAPSSSDLLPSVRVLPEGVTRQMAALPVGNDDEAALGISGTDADSWYYESIAGGTDDVPDLHGKQKYVTYRTMVLSDPAVRSLVWLYKLPIRSAEWTLEPASKDPIDVAIAAFFGKQFGIGPEHPVPLLDLTWDDSISQALECLPNGAMAEELIYARDLVEWIDPDGEIHDLRVLARLAPRWASSVHEVKRNKMTGEIDWIEQDLPDAKPIPGSKLAWYMSERTGSSPWGTALIRPAYGAWKMKRGIMVADAVGYDRFSSGVPVVRYPSGSGTEYQSRAENIGRNYRTHERGWVVFEGPKEAGWDIEILNAAATMADPISRLRHYDQQIAMAGLQQFSSLGTTDTGSRAVGETLSDPFYLAVQSVAKSLAATRMKYVMRRLADINFGEDVPIPTLTASKIQGRAIATLSRAIADLAAAGLAFTDPDTQNDIRDQLDLRHLPPEVADAIEDHPVGIAPIGEGGTIIEGNV